MRKSIFLAVLALLSAELFNAKVASAQFGLPAAPPVSNLPRAKFEEVSLKLGALFPVMSVYEGIADFDGVGENIKYKTVGSAKYDNIFSESASINGRMQQTKFLTGKYGAKPADFATNSAKAASTAAKDKAAKMMDFKTVLAELSASLTKDQSRASELLSQLGGLRPQEDFSPLDAGGVVDAVGKAKENLQSAVSEAPKLATEIANISKGSK